MQVTHCNRMVANSVLLFCIYSAPIWRIWMHLLIIRPCEYSLGLPGVMSYHLVPHMPRLVTMVAIFYVLMKSEQFDLFTFGWWWWCRPHPVREHAQDLRPPLGARPASPPTRQAAQPPPRGPSTNPRPLV